MRARFGRSRSDFSSSLRIVLARAITAGGNYGEIFDRDIGGGSALKLDRGLNALWNAQKPGLLYAPPMR